MEELKKSYLEFAALKNKYKESAIDYVKKSVAVHGSLFELECNDYDSWDDAIEHEGSFITNQIPYSVECDDNCCSYEVYITAVNFSADCKKAYITGYSFEEGYGWVENEPCRLSLDNLCAIAEFVHLVMDEESWRQCAEGKPEAEESRKVLGYQLYDEDGNLPEDLFSFMVFRSEKDARDYMECEKLEGFSISKYYEGDIEDPTVIGLRILKKGERVFNDEPDPIKSDFRDWASVYEDTAVLYADQTVMLDIKGWITATITSDACSVYQIAEGKACPKCGGPLCIEHDPEVDYPYYCPECDENFYSIEVE